MCIGTEGIVNQIASTLGVYVKPRLSFFPFLNVHTNTISTLLERYSNMRFLEDQSELLLLLLLLVLLVQLETLRILLVNVFY